MGFNTTVIVLNDALDHIAEDPKFGERLADAVKAKAGITRTQRIDVPAGNHGNAASVLDMTHSSGYSVMIIGGNTGKQLGHVSHCRPFDDDGHIEVLRQLADQYGYRLSKKPRKD